MSAVEVNKVNPSSGTNLQLGDSGDTITIPAGATFDSSAATNTLPANVVTTDGTQTLTNKSIVATQLTGTITPSDNTVSIAKLTATGTKDATTFLRGDNTFAEAGGGLVLQVVQGTRSTQTANTSLSFVTTNLEVSITPSSASNKVLVIAQGNAETSAGAMYFDIFRDSTAVSGLANGLTAGQYVNFAGSVAVNYLDSPNTTSAITYSLRYRQSSSGTGYFPAQTCLATIIAIEIAG